MPLVAIIGVVSILVTTLAIAARTVQFDITRPWQFLMALLQVGVLVASIVLLGPVFGPLIAFFAVAGLILIVSSRLYLEFDKITAGAAVYWRIAPVESRQFLRRLSRRDKKAFGLLGLTGTARLCAALAKCARSPDEVMLMAKPITMLSAIFDEDATVLAPRFDGLLRRFGEPPEQALRVADILTRAAQITPGSFDDVMGRIETFAEEIGKAAAT